MSAIIVYTKPACPQCTATKNHLTKIGADFETVDISQAAAALDYVRSLGYQAAPVIVAGEEHFTGFRPDRLTELASARVLV